MKLHMLMAYGIGRAVRRIRDKAKQAGRLTGWSIIRGTQEIFLLAQLRQRTVGAAGGRTNAAMGCSERKK